MNETIIFMSRYLPEINSRYNMQLLNYAKIIRSKILSKIFSFLYITVYSLFYMSSKYLRVYKTL